MRPALGYPREQRFQLFENPLDRLRGGRDQSRECQEPMAEIVEFDQLDQDIASRSRSLPN